MNTEDIIFEEWKSLRGEIARRQESIERILLASIAGSGAIYSFALKDSSEVISALFVLLPIITTTISYYWILTIIFSTTRISKYISEYIEPNLSGLGWEKWVNRPENARHNNARLPKVTTYGLIYNCTYLVSCFLCVVKIYFLSVAGKLNGVFSFASLVGSCLVLLLFWGSTTHRLLINNMLNQIKSLSSRT